MFKDWINIFKNLHKKAGSHQNCPNCKKEEIKYQYVGDITSRIGYLSIWCPKCLNGVQLSRVKIPEIEEIIPFEAPESLLQEKIPNFKRIHPK